jgi:AcrR family transcriptional regulator
MSEKEKKPGRTHNAEGARRSILDAAEEAFANYGYAGARVDDIAAQAGYNKGLLFRYFSDKLSLYKEVLKRADRETNQLRAQLLSPLFMDEGITTNIWRFKELLENMIRANFDYLVEHPRVFRILIWEMADGWKNYSQISAEFPQPELEPFHQVCQRAVEAGLLRSDFAPLIQLTITQPICQIYLAYLPIYRLSYPGQDPTTPDEIEKAKEFIVGFILSGLLNSTINGITE